MFIIISTAVVSLFIYWYCRKRIELTFEMIKKTVSLTAYEKKINDKYSGYVLFINAFKDTRSQKIINISSKIIKNKKANLLVLDGYTLYRDDDSILEKLQLKALPVLLFFENGERKKTGYLLKLNDKIIYEYIEKYVNECDENVYSQPVAQSH